MIISILGIITPAPSVQLSRNRLQLKSLKPGSGKKFCTEDPKFQQ